MPKLVIQCTEKESGGGSHFLKHVTVLSLFIWTSVAVACHFLALGKAWRATLGYELISRHLSRGQKMPECVLPIFRLCPSVNDRLFISAYGQLMLGLAGI